MTQAQEESEGATQLARFMGFDMNSIGYVFDHPDWDPFRNLDHAIMVEGKIMQRDLYASYASALIRRTAASRYSNESLYLRLNMKQVFAVAHASPRDRALAALEAIGAVVQKRA